MEVSKDILLNFSRWSKDCLEKVQFGKPLLFKSGGCFTFKAKEGNKIHIKKENRGKFTDYCGGEVTSACILKGKNSSDPKIRKRATFAANARKWKHKSGGTIRYTEDGKRVPDKCPKCGKDLRVEIHGEPIYICKNKHYFGTVKFNK